jgi:hypothetical protein
MANLIGQSADDKIAAIKGEYTGTGPTYVHDGGKGVQGHSQNGYGVQGTSVVGRGVVASSDTNYGLRASSRTLSAARCSSSEGTGVEGEAGGTGDGVRGTSINGNGIHGISQTSFGVLGESRSGRGVVARSDTDYGLRASSRTSAGIRGSSDEGRGVEGWAVKSEGVVGVSAGGNGVWGQTEGAGVGVLGTSKIGIGVFGKGGRLAGFFEGDVEVTGDIRLTNADCAEDFDIADTDPIEPGTVMVLGDDEGALHQSRRPYDKRVAGVVSGAGDYKPGIVLDKRQSENERKPIALLGKVFCKVDARFGAIEVGDLLTTSATPGHAMKTNDPLKAFGAVIGKALRPLKEGQGLIPILIALQ